MSLLKVRTAQRGEAGLLRAGLAELSTLHSLRRVAPWNLTAIEKEAEAQTKDLIAVAEDAQGELSGWIWVEYGVLTPYGIGYGNWWSHFVWIKHLWVSQSKRRQGVAQEMLKQAVTYTRAHKINEILLGVYVDDNPAHDTAAKFGFKDWILILAKSLTSATPAKRITPETDAALEFGFATAKHEQATVESMLEIYALEGESDRANPSLAEERTQYKLAMAEQRILVATDKSTGELVSYIWWAEGHIFPYGLTYGKWRNKYTWISCVYTNPKWRGKEIANELYERAGQIAFSRGIPEMINDIYCSNENSIAFHKKLGFNSIVVIMQLKLE